MPALATPVQWHSPSAAYAALGPLLDSSGSVDHMIVRMAPGNPHYPQQGSKYRLAVYAVVGGTGVFIDAASRRPLFNISGWILA